MITGAKCGKLRLTLQVLQSGHGGSRAGRQIGIAGWIQYTVYHKKYAHGFVVLCFVVVMQSFIINSHEVFIHIHLGCFAGTGTIVRLPQCQWSKPDGYGEISQCITTTKHSKAKTVCIFLGIYCTPLAPLRSKMIWIYPLFMKNSHDWDLCKNQKFHIMCMVLNPIVFCKCFLTTGKLNSLCNHHVMYIIYDHQNSVKLFSNSYNQITATVIMIFLDCSWLKILTFASWEI